MWVVDHRSINSKILTSSKSFNIPLREFLWLQLCLNYGLIFAWLSITSILFQGTPYFNQMTTDALAWWLLKCGGILTTAVIIWKPFATLTSENRAFLEITEHNCNEWQQSFGFFFFFFVPTKYSITVTVKKNHWQGNILTHKQKHIIYQNIPTSPEKCDIFKFCSKSYGSFAKTAASSLRGKIKMCQVF